MAFAFVSQQSRHGLEELSPFISSDRELSWKAMTLQMDLRTEARPLRNGRLQAQTLALRTAVMLTVKSSAESREEGRREGKEGGCVWAFIPALSTVPHHSKSSSVYLPPDAAEAQINLGWVFNKPIMVQAHCLQRMEVLPWFFLKAQYDLFTVVIHISIKILL